MFHEFYSLNLLVVKMTILVLPRLHIISEILASESFNDVIIINIFLMTLYETRGK